MLFAALVLGGCAGGGEGPGGSAREGGTIAIALSPPLGSLDPARATTAASRESVWLVYTPPLTYRRSEGRAGTELVPGVAEGLPAVSADGTTYTFKLRRRLRYSSGAPVRASDFEHTIRRALTLSSTARRLFVGIAGVDVYLRARRPEADIAGIDADDKRRQVEIRLEHPDSKLPHALATTFAGLVPRGTPFRDLTRRPPAGVGPYTIARSVPGRGLLLRKNRRFRLPGIPRGYVDEVNARVSRGRARDTRDVVSGKLDYIQEPPPVEQLPEIRSEYKDRYSEHRTLSTRFLSLSSRAKPFDRERLREAVAHAIDEPEAARLLGGFLDPTCNVLPPDLAGYRKIDPCPWGDPEGEPDLVKARELVESLGAGRSIVTVGGGGRDRRLRRYFVGTLRKIGLRGRTRRAGVRASLDVLHPGLPDAAGVLQPLAARSRDSRLRSLGAELARETDSDKVAELAAEVDRKLVEEAVVVPYGNEKRTTFLSERMDFENCSRFHPVYGNDYSSFCLR